MKDKFWTEVIEPSSASLVYALRDEVRARVKNGNLRCANDWVHSVDFTPSEGAGVKLTMVRKDIDDDHMVSIYMVEPCANGDVVLTKRFTPPFDENGIEEFHLFDTWYAIKKEDYLRLRGELAQLVEKTIDPLMKRDEYF